MDLYKERLQPRVISVVDNNVGGSIPSLATKVFKIISNKMMATIQEVEASNVIIWEGSPMYEYENKVYQFSTWKMTFSDFLKKYQDHNIIAILYSCINNLHQEIRAVVIPK